MRFGLHRSRTIGAITYDSVPGSATSNQTKVVAAMSADNSHTLCCEWKLHFVPFPKLLCMT